MLNQLEQKDFEVLKSEVDKDLEELGIKKKKRHKKAELKPTIFCYR